MAIVILEGPPPKQNVRLCTHQKASQYFLLLNPPPPGRNEIKKEREKKKGHLFESFCHNYIENLLNNMQKDALKHFYVFISLLINKLKFIDRLKASCSRQLSV